MGFASSFVTRRLLFLLGLIAGAPAIAEQADTAAAQYCEISMELVIKGQLVAAPSAVVEFGKEAGVTLRDADGVHGWQINFVVDEPTVVRRILVLPTRIQLFELDGDQSVLRAEPHLSIQPGQRADLEMPLADTNGGRAKLGVMAAILSDADVQKRLDAPQN